MNRNLLPLATFILLLTLHRASAQPPPDALATFNTYVAAQESRLSKLHAIPITASPQIEQLTPTVQPAGVLIHHWRATAFAPSASAAEFEQLLRDFTHYPQIFAPQVLRASTTQQPDGHWLATLRVRQKHVLTVVLDSTYDVTFNARSPTDHTSSSRSTRIYEIANANTAAEHPLSPTEEHGFLWRQNTYWTWQQRPGGLAIQLESISLSRAIPTGLGWAVRPFIQSVPRDSLEFTLHSALTALHTK